MGPCSRGGRRFFMKRFPIRRRGILMNADIRRDQANEMLGCSMSLLIMIGPLDVRIWGGVTEGSA